MVDMTDVPKLDRSFAFYISPLIITSLGVALQTITVILTNPSFFFFFFQNLFFFRENSTISLGGIQEA